MTKHVNSNEEKNRITLELLRSTEKAGHRVRFILIIIITASIIAFAGFWNSRESSWKNKRLESLDVLSEFVVKQTDFSNIFLPPETSLGQVDKFLREKNFDGFKRAIMDVFLEESIKKSKSSLLKEIKTKIERFEEKNFMKFENFLCKLFINYNKKDNPHSDFYILKKRVDSVHKEQSKLNLDKRNVLLNAIEYFKPKSLSRPGVILLTKSSRILEEEQIHTIKIPFFNSGFDVNDLGLIGGFSFFILMLIFYYSLRREYENLMIVYDFLLSEFRSRKERIKYYYLLSMNQFFSSPVLPLRNEPNRRVTRIKRIIFNDFTYWLLKHFSKLLYFLPLALSISILVYDFRSKNIGDQISSSNASVGIYGCFAFTILLFICTIMCLIISIQFDKIWAKIRQEIEREFAKRKISYGHYESKEEEAKTSE